MRELAVQARNGTDGNSEFASLNAEIGRIGEATEWSGIKLLNGSRRGLELQVDIGTTRALRTGERGGVAHP